MELIKHSYELSVWDFPEEVKKATIGSDTMSSPARVLDPILTRNVNGTVTLTFKLYTQYFDNDKGDFVENPFIPLLMTERILKLKYKGKWYDLVIKNRQESSDQKMYSYTAKSLHINELSKNGFELEFKTELENNQGTIFELGDRIVDGTDWTIDRSGSKLPRAWRDDQLILCKATTSFPQNYTGTVMLTKDDYPINRGEYFYAFYSDWTNFAANGGEIQLLCILNHKSENLENCILEGEYFDSDGIITIKDAKENIVAQNILAKDLNKDTIEKIGISNYRGRRLVKQQKTKYNSVLDKYVNIYNNGEVEGYTKTKYLSPTFVQNLIVNSKDFTSTAGWYADVTNTSHASVDLDIYPPIDVGANENTLYSSRIRFTASESGQIVYNTAIRSNLTKIDEIKPQDIYILRYKFVDTEDNLISNAPVNFQFTTSKIDGRDIIKTITVKNQASASVNGFYEREVIFTSALTKKQLQDIRFEIVLNSTDSIYLKEMELFKKVEAIKQIKDDEGNISYTDKNEILYPGDIPKSDPIEEKFFYNVADNINAKEADDYKYLENTDTNSYIAVYNDNEYEKIASIEKSESNRFNLIQDLCESFECWADFIIEHDDDGKIVEKKIQFKEYIGNTKWTGFKYGINLKSVQRTIDSEQIVTKTIVKANSNEHGANGFCTIERAVDNPTGQSYILNFDYYLSQGLLDRESLTNDLYINFEGNNKGFYDLMQEKSRLRDDIITRRTAESASFLEGIAYLKVAQETKEAANQELSELLAEYKKYSNVEYPTIAESAQKDGEILDQKVVEYFASIGRVKQVLSTAEQDCIDYADFTQEAYDEIMKGYEQEIENLQIEEINNQFLDKYKNFIQEGTWTSEEYWDDNLYYLDALDVSRTSSKPKVTYTINVIDVSVFEDYQAYNIDVGDKTFVEDAEFFGYTLYQSSEDSSSYKKLYREEIVVTEIQEHLEAPEANQIKVQNYKTQFDDLFQRITASTQSLQYASGGYNRASAAFNNDGTIDGNILQNTLLAYAFTLVNPENDTVLWDEDGIKIIDRKDTSKILKLAGGELTITNNGGETWATAIDANGIHINLVTSGIINTDKILIGNSKDYSFRWDNLGLNAYTQDVETGAYNYGKFVRFDKYGLYGYSQGEYFEPSELNEVKESADFGLTWDGFFLKSKHDDPNDNGYIEIDSKEDFQVFGSDGERRVKIGLIGVETEDQTTTNEAGETVTETVITDRIYGLRLYDKDGNSVVDTDSNGNISITGTIKATSGNIGNWQIVNGNITSAQTETEYGTQGIVLDATNSQIYSAQYKTSLGMDGWSINNDEAIFNNITLRGALKCAVLEYGEVQAVGGILMIRPSTTIKDFHFIEDENGNTIKLELEVENPFLFRIGDWVKIASNPGDPLDLKDKNGEMVIYSGLNTNLLQCLEIKEITKEDGVKTQIVVLDLTNLDSASGTSVDNLKALPLKGMGLVDLGTPSTETTQGSIGISLNSSDNKAMVPETSFSMFTLEERKKQTGEGTWKYLQPHILLGKIPNNENIYGTVAGKYGLYADAAEITGAIHATSISTVDTSGKETQLPIGTDGKLSQEAIGGLKDSLSSLQDQVDGVIDTWYLEDEPSVDRPPWGNTAENDKHIGDLYYDKKTGYSYRFWKKEDETYEWARISDSDITTALNQIAQTNAALDTKVSTFMEQAGVVTPNIVPQSANEGDLLFTQDGKIYILGADRKWKLQIQEIVPKDEQYEYAQTNSGTEIPNSWNSDRPEPVPGKYLWTKTTIIYSDGSTSESYTVAYQGVDGQNGAPGASGRNLIIFGEQVFKKGENDSYSPNTITLVARYSDNPITDQQVYWSYKNGNDFTPIHTQITGNIWNQQTVHISSNKCEINPINNDSYFINDIATIRAQVKNNNVVEYEDIFSVYRISDGYTPQKGQDYFDGTDGEDGTSIVWQGTFSTPPKNPQNGWAYYNSTAKASYVYQNGAWYQMSIDGVNGQDGNDGKSIVWQGELEDSPTNPQVNWVYKDTSDGKVYIFNGTGWELMVLDGSDGADGADGTDGLSVFITYNNSQEKPNKPTGNGTTNGWSTVASSDAIWMSQKVAESATAGTWGEPIKIKGQDGNDAITIILSNENHTFSGDLNGKIATAQSTTCSITAYKGTTQQYVTIKSIIGTDIDNGAITIPSQTTGASLIPSFTVTAVQDETPSTSGTLIISLEIDGKTFTKTFSYSIAKQGEQGSSGAFITSVTTQYATVGKGDGAPAENSNLWKDVSPTSYSSSNDYYYRYKQIYSDGTVKYTSPSNWFNPYSVKNGAVLEFDSNGYVVRELLKGLTWSYVASQNIMQMPSTPDHTRGEDKKFVIVQFEGSDKTHVLSYDNLAVHTNILAEGTIIASNGLIGGWTISSSNGHYYLKSSDENIFLRSDYDDADARQYQGLIAAGKKTIEYENGWTTGKMTDYNFKVLKDGTIKIGYAGVIKNGAGQYEPYHNILINSGGGVVITGELVATSLTVLRPGDRRENFEDIMSNLETEVQGISISGEQVFKKLANSSVSPSSITLTATKTSGLTITSWQYKRGDSSSWANLNTTNSSFTINSSGTNPNFNTFFNNDNKVTSFRVNAKDTKGNNYFDDFSVYIVSDGEQGQPGAPGTPGADAYTIILSNENFSFTTDANGYVLPSGNQNQQTTCRVSALKGASPINIQITGVTKSNNISITGYTLNTEREYIDLTIAATQNTQIGENGKITLTLKVDGNTITKELTYSINRQGATGGKGDDAVRYYLTASNQFIRKNTSGILSPTSITFYSKKQTGTSDANYSAYFEIATSPDGVNFSKDTSASATTAQKTYSFSSSATIKAIRARIYSSSNSTTVLSELIIPVLEDGLDGDSYYTYIRYSNSSDGSNFDTNSSGKAYIGICTTTSASPPTNKTSYTWSKFKGEDGKGISSTTIEYATHTNGTSAPSGGWGTSIPIVSQGQYLWTRTTITYTSGNPSVSYSVSKAATDGASITNVEIEYYESNSSSQLTGGSWSITIPNTYNPDKHYFYRYKYTYSNSSTPEYSSHIPWDNPKKVQYYLDAGSVLKFDASGNLVQTYNIGLDWGFTNSNDLPTTFPTDKTSNPTSKPNIVVRKTGDVNKANWYLASRSGLIVQSNAIIEGTIMASNGIISSWTINNIGLVNDVVPVPGTNPNGVYVARAYVGPGLCNPISTDGISQTGAWAGLADIGANLAFWDFSNGSYNLNFAVDTKGQLYARNANITGRITATSGIIGGLEIKKQPAYTWENVITFSEYTYLSDSSKYFRISPDGIGFGFGQSVDTSPTNRIFMTLGIPQSNPFEDYMNHTMRLGITEGTDIYGENSAFAYLQLYGDVDIDYLDVTIARIGTIASSVTFDSSVEFNHRATFNYVVDCNNSFTSDIGATFYNLALFENDCHVYQRNTFDFTYNKVVFEASTVEFDNGITIGSGASKDIGFIELYGGTSSNYNTPYIDFHHGGDSKDFTSRIIESRIGGLDICSAYKKEPDVLESDASGTGYKYHNYIRTGVQRTDTQGGKFNNVLDLSCPSGSAVVIRNNRTHTTAGAWNDCCFRTSTSEVGGTLTGTWKLNGTTMSATSDRNLKNSINTLSDKYSKLFDNLIPVQYKLNDGTSDRYHTGFIAQDVEEAILKVGLTTQDFAGFVRDNEETVVTEDGTVKQQLALRYEEFIALNTNEIQKLKKRVAELEEQVTQLLNQQN